MMGHDEAASDLEADGALAVGVEGSVRGGGQVRCVSFALHVLLPQHTPLCRVPIPQPLLPLAIHSALFAVVAIRSLASAHAGGSSVDGGGLSVDGGVVPVGVASIHARVPSTEAAL